MGSIASEPGWSTVIIRTKKGAEFWQKAIDMNLIMEEEIQEGDSRFTMISRIAKSKDKKFAEIRRAKMPQQDPMERISNFEEVPYGLTDEMMIQEAQRCLPVSYTHLTLPTN